MKRIQLFEFEDLPWFPGWMRAAMTRNIVVLSRWMSVPETLAVLVARALDESGAREIVDMGSGAGGSMPEVLAQLHTDPAHADITLTLTDLYPNTDAMRAFNNGGVPHIRYQTTPLDATDISSAPPGLKTMVNSFHHIPPENARQILATAQDAHEPLLVYEIANNNVPSVAFWLFLPVGLLVVALMCLVITPFTRPLTARQLIFTYLIPVIPLAYAWDGQASLVRTYALSDYDLLLADIQRDGYCWEVGQAESPSGRKFGTYLFGYPC